VIELQYQYFKNFNFNTALKIKAEIIIFNRHKNLSFRLNITAKYLLKMSD